jgi:hypothetical protein
MIAIMELLKARKRRRVSEAERLRLANLSAEFSPMRHRTERPPGPKTDAEDVA